MQLIKLANEVLYQVRNNNLIDVQVPSSVTRNNTGIDVHTRKEAKSIRKRPNTIRNADYSNYLLCTAAVLVLYNTPKTLPAVLRFLPYFILDQFWSTVFRPDNIQSPAPQIA